MPGLILLTISGLFLTFPAAKAETPASAPVLLFRKILVRECDAGGKCQAPLSSQAEAARVEIPLERVGYGKGGGLHGEDRLKVEAAGIPFRSELFLNKTAKGVSVYAVLRSGPGTKRQGVTRKFTLADLEKGPITIVDDAIEREGKWYRAELVVGAAELPPVPGKSVSLGIRYLRGGKLLCEARHELRSGESLPFCASQKGRGQAPVEVRATIIPPEAQQATGATLDQVLVTTRYGAGEGQVVALDNEQAVMETGAVGAPGESFRLELLPYVIW